MKLADYDAVVLANGDYPTAEVPLRLLREARNVVVCDGAAAPLLMEGETSEGWSSRDNHGSNLIIIGDGDSIPDGLRDQLIRVDEQDDNDLTKATRYCLDRGWQHIAYLGATGKREDHTIGNLSLLVRYYREMGVTPVMATDYGWFVPATGDMTFESFQRQQVSLFNISCTRLVSNGLKWDAYPYSQLWQGTLNEAIGQNFTIEADGVYLVYRTYAGK